MDIRIIPQQPRRLEHDDGIVGKAKIAGKADHEAGGNARGDRDYRARSVGRRGASVAQFGINRILSRVTPR